MKEEVDEIEKSAEPVDETTTDKSLEKSENSAKPDNETITDVTSEDSEKGSEKSTEKLTIDSILEEFRAKENNPLALPPPSEYPEILQKVMENLPDTYPYELNIEDSSFFFKNPREALIFHESFGKASYLYFEKPKHLVENATGFTDFMTYLTQKNEAWYIRSSSATLDRLKLIQQWAMIFGVPYSEWTKAYLVCFKEDWVYTGLNRPGFDYQMPWGDFVTQLSRNVSVEEDVYFDFKTPAKLGNFAEYDLVGPFIKQKLMMIKSSPAQLFSKKQESLLILKEFVQKHIPIFNNYDFVPSMTNFEEIEDAVSKLKIRFTTSSI